jgi:transposase InsO family protein
MTDNASSYGAPLTALKARAIKHPTTQAYRLRTKGKVKRFHQPMAREWADGTADGSHHHRDEAVPHWLRHYSERRAHGSIGGPTPISRVHNLRGQDS